MKTVQFNYNEPLRFRHFSRKGYALFSSLGKEVLIGVLSVSTLTYAKAQGISTKLVAAADTAATAREQAVGLDEVIVTATRAPLTKGQQARMVTVLDRSDIAAAPVQSVNDLLKYAAGVDVRQRGPIGAQTDVSIRGGNYEQITIMLNGINICDPQTGHNAFDVPIDISEIERIEILEGPAGRVYGTSSLLGAVNIVTRTPQASSADVHAEGGSYGYLSAGGRVNARSGRWNNQLSAGYTRSDGYSRSKSGALNADYRGGKAFYQGNYEDEQVRVKWHAGLSVKGFGSNTFYGLKWDEQYEHTLKTFTTLQAENKQGRLHIKPAVYWNRNEDRFELFRGAQEKYPFNYHRTDVMGINLNSYFDWALGRTAIGAEIRNEDLVSGNLGEPLDHPKHIHGTDRKYEYGLNRTNTSLMVEHNVLLKRFTLSAGLVAVKNSWSDMSMKVYPGMDATWHIGGGWNAFASFNSSLRMPSVTELYYAVGGHKADKHLKPEELSAIEAGVKYQGEGVRGSLSMYRNRFRNLIDWVRDTSLGPQAEWESRNFGRIDAWGLEGNLALDLQQLLPGQRTLRQLQLAYSYIDQEQEQAKNIESKYVLEYLRNKVVGKLRLNLLHAVNMDVAYRYQDRQGSYTDTGGNVRNYHPYSVVDVRLSWVKPAFEAYAECNNLTNHSYTDYGNIPQPGIWFVAGVKLGIKL